MLAKPLTRMRRRRSSGQNRRVVALKHSMSASRSGAAIEALDFGIFRGSEIEVGIAGLLHEHY